MITEKYFTINDTSIRVCMSGNSDKAIVFVHGNSCSSEFWDNQLNDLKLSNQYQLIAFDLPGHGKSGKSNYELKNLSSIIPQVIHQLNIQSYILAGLSFGTTLIAEACPFLKNCRGFFLASPNIINDHYQLSSLVLPFPEVYALAVASVPDEVLTGFAEHLVYDISSELVEDFKKSYLNTDPAFRIALGNTIQQNEWTDEIANLVNTNLPCAILYGREEKIVNIHYLDNYKFPERFNIQIIEKAAHFVNSEQEEVFNNLLIGFAERAFK